MSIERLNQSTATLDAQIPFRDPVAKRDRRTTARQLRDLVQANLEVDASIISGALAGGITDCTPALRTALATRRNGWASARFTTPGVYYVAQQVALGARTLIYIGAGVTIKTPGTIALFVNGDGTGAGGYSGAGQLVFMGEGVIDCNNGLGAANLSHAEGVVFRGLTVKNGKDTHLLEINSSKDVLISECTFDGMAVTDGNKHELIQIDYSYSSGFPFFGPYDNTPCRNVVVESCVFKNGHSGLGSHASPPAGLHNGITVRDCGFYSMTAYGIRAEGWGAGSEISNNYLENCGDRPVYVLGNTDGLDVLYNTVVGGSTTNLSGLRFSESNGVYPKNCNVIGNKVYDAMGDGIYLGGLTGGIVQLNEVYRCAKSGFSLSNGTSGLRLQHNKVYGCGSAGVDYSAFYIGSGCSNNVIEYNVARQSGLLPNSYLDGIRVKDISAIGNRVNWNDIEAGFAGSKINNSGTLTEIDGETYLTGILGVTSGDIALLDSVANYRRLAVATGTVGAGTLMTDEARGWYSEGFRPGTDAVNVRSKNGTVSMTIPAATTLSIVGTAPDSVRYVIGVGRIG